VYRVNRISSTKQECYVPFESRSHASIEVKGAFDQTCSSKAIVSAQETVTISTNIDGSLKRDSNDCLVKDIGKKRSDGKVDASNI